jgi:hypothetical protein
MAQHWTGQIAGADAPRGTGFDAWIVGGQLTRDDFRRARKWLIVAGVIALITGFVAIAVPIIASVAIAIFIG